MRRCVYSSWGSVRICAVLPYSTTSPRCITRVSVQMRETTARSCVTKTMERPNWSRTSSMSSSTCACTETSSALVASSSTSSFGPAARAFASATRCRWPPESAFGRAASWSGRRPTRSSSDAATVSASRRAPPRCRRTTSATARPIGMRGSSDRYGSWNTICVVAASSRRSAPDIARSGRATPPNDSSPASACSSPTRMRASVDLPDPDSPTMPSDPPRASAKPTPESAVTSSRPGTR